jgi:U4/U6.U5 tri-snRNP-associated protein 2
LRVETQQVVVRPDAGENEKPRFDIDRGMRFKIAIHERQPDPSKDIKAAVLPFLFLAVDLPPPPLFQDSVEKNIIPQVSIHSVLAKYDGKTTQVRRKGSYFINTKTVLGIGWTTSAF